MERIKFLSRDGRRLFKFEGLGHFGADTKQRARVLADAGFAPAAVECADGYICYERHPGMPATRGEICQTLLDRMAEYCAFRAEEMAVPSAGTEELARMLQWNLQEEFGCELPPPEELEIRRPLVPDGHMQPHEWLLTSRGVLKADATSHGDDHFFPGPTDVAWDLAGAVVEWELLPPAREYLLERYHRLSGDDAGPRLPGFLRAYTAFRLGYCRMAAEALSGTVEEERLLRDYRRYRALARPWASRQAAA
jgi:hypothetical protein